MSFGGHHTKKASDQLQKKLQEEAMSDDADKLAAGMAGMDVKDDDKMSIVSSAPSSEAAENEVLRQQIKQAQAQIAMYQASTATMQQQMAAAEVNMCEEQKKFNAIISNSVFTSAIGAMKDEIIDIYTLWWMVQWGKEYVARFEAGATKQQLESFQVFKTWTSTKKKKKDYGFWASMPKKRGQGDDSFQSP
jgi:hypothetical protein